MRQDLAHLPPTPAQLARYCGGTKEEYLASPDITQVIFSCIKQGRPSPKNTLVVPPENLGAMIEAGKHLRFPFISCVMRTGKRCRATLQHVVDNLFDLKVNGFVVCSYRATHQFSTTEDQIDTPKDVAPGTPEPRKKDRRHVKHYTIQILVPVSEGDQVHDPFSPDEVYQIEKFEGPFVAEVIRMSAETNIRVGEGRIILPRMVLPSKVSAELMGIVLAKLREDDYWDSPLTLNAVLARQDTLEAHDTIDYRVLFIPVPENS